MSEGTDNKETFIRLYRMSGGTAEDGERMWAIKCRDKAAPELLAACKLALEQSHAMGDEAIHALEAAIAKAEGRAIRAALPDAAGESTVADGTPTS